MEKLDLSPKKAEHYVVSDLTGLVNKLIHFGATHNMVQTLAMSDSTEAKMTAHRIVDAWKNINPFDLLTNTKRQWETIYNYCFRRFGDKENAFAISLPEHYPTEQVIPVLKDITVNEVVSVCRQYFKVKCSEHYFDSMSNFRETYHGDYCVIVKKIINACEDQQFLQRSYNDLEREGHLGITLIERLLLELHYFLTTGNHLDNSDWSSTICTGSYFKNNGVPKVRCNNGVVEIDCIPPDVVIKGNMDCSREVTVI